MLFFASSFREIVFIQLTVQCGGCAKQTPFKQLLKISRHFITFTYKNTAFFSITGDFTIEKNGVQIYVGRERIYQKNS